ncbi:MAG TPA: sensor domain-containing diguanylate cyclase [Syntrophales bacterium]|nr:sensor domain-containing diguanylate cyclase [Syntrophales bacterium]HOM07758.1 sensor domain-containing diguanylate cyclase [Syntrophales bacterium]HON99473.1 sensor domain-containing diguanylate cyclase [Syntrophales bacterium]HPQ06010.1 sensor domain-containing diguanylate cyclase [Syntrophales bacterium]HRS86627.1 sensor domain-containing diguanylate cyclase [Syntrophales bacterium]
MAVPKEKIRKLIKLGDLLCASFTLEEAYGVIAREMPHLFPAGAYYGFNRAKGLLEVRAWWGQEPREGVIVPQDCHAVRRNRPHLVAGTAKGLPCRHIEAEGEKAASLCVPLSSQGELMGMVHLRFEGTAVTSPRTVETSKQLALVAAQQIRLALWNIGLRGQISDLSQRDFLTGLVNRRFLEPALEREIRKGLRQGQSVGVAFVDIDRLGRINQTYGIEEGERIIRDLGQFLAERARDRDIVCRWGADEFVVILPGYSLDDARRYAENIRGLLGDRAQEEGGSHLRRVTLSIGVAAAPLHGETAGDVLQAARGAVKRAKEEGRDRVALPP